MKLLIMLLLVSCSSLQHSASKTEVEPKETAARVK
jgi:hypothetical protein